MTKSDLPEPEFADVAPHQGFESGWNRLQTAVEILVAVIVGAGLLGLLGTGPLSSARATLRGEPATITYQRILRRTVQAQMVIDLTRPVPTGTLEFELPNSFLDQVDVVSTSPRSSAMRAEADGITYVFDLGAARTGRIIFSVKPESFGLMNSTIRVLGTQTVLRQFVFP